RRQRRGPAVHAQPLAAIVERHVADTLLDAGLVLDPQDRQGEGQLGPLAAERPFVGPGQRPVEVLELRNPAQDVLHHPRVLVVRLFEQEAVVLDLRHGIAGARRGRSREREERRGDQPRTRRAMSHDAPLPAAAGARSARFRTSTITPSSPSLPTTSCRPPTSSTITSSSLRTSRTRTSAPGTSPTSFHRPIWRWSASRISRTVARIPRSSVPRGRSG